jgi:hypothetical protein
MPPQQKIDRSSEKRASHRWLEPGAPAELGATSCAWSALSATIASLQLVQWTAIAVIDDAVPSSQDRDIPMIQQGSRDNPPSPELGLWPPILGVAALPTLTALLIIRPADEPQRHQDQFQGNPEGNKPVEPVHQSAPQPWDAKYLIKSL